MQQVRANTLENNVKTECFNKEIDDINKNLIDNLKL